MSGTKGVSTADPLVCTVSWCTGLRGCAGVDHQSKPERVTATGDDPAKHREDGSVVFPDLLVLASTNGDLRQDVVTVALSSDAWEIDLRPAEARYLATLLTRHADLVESEPGATCRGTR